MADRRANQSPPSGNPPPQPRPRSPHSPRSPPPTYTENDIAAHPPRGSRPTHIQEMQNWLDRQAQAATELFPSLPPPVPSRAAILRRQRLEEYQASRPTTSPPVHSVIPIIPMPTNTAAYIQSRIPSVQQIVRSVMHEEVHMRGSSNQAAAMDLRNNDHQGQQQQSGQLRIGNSAFQSFNNNIPTTVGELGPVEECPQCNEGLRLDTVTIQRPSVHQHQVSLSEVTDAIMEARRQAERCITSVHALEDLLFPANGPRPHQETAAAPDVPRWWQLTPQQTEKLLEHTLKLAGTDPLEDRRFLQANPPELPSIGMQKTLLKGQTFGLIQQPPTRCCACKRFQTVMMESDETHDMFRCLDCSSRTVAYR